MNQQTHRYSVVLELFSPFSTLPPLSPLLPQTATGLPFDLDARLKAVYDRLVLPKSFWQPLPGQPLDLSTPPPAPTRLDRPSSSSRSWSDPSSSTTGVAQLTSHIAVKSTLGTPPPPPPDPTQKATLDFRFGPLFIDWVENPTPRELTSVSMSPVNSTEAGSSKGLIAALAENPRKNSLPEIDVEKAGTTELYWGTIHLYKESGAVETSSEEEKRKAKDLDDGTVVGMVSVPGNLTPATILTFLAPALGSVAQLRILRDSTPNRQMVLIRFREKGDASEFKIMYNGRLYHDHIESEVCHVVSIASIKLKSTTTPPFTFPYSPDIETKATDVIELPTCPVCLERMDANVSGLIQVMCQHSFHCSCLLKWGDSRCPVCRSTNYGRMRRTTVSSTPAAPSACAVCQSLSNLWICLICGIVGCGRYQGGHAHSHFDESGHSYAMELETQRVWDYAGDSYVHRLIRNRADGKLVELPSLAGVGVKGGDDVNGKGGPDRSDEASQDKLEAMGVEYANLMTSQLQSQREYYEEELRQYKQEIRSIRRKWEDTMMDNARSSKEKVDLERKNVVLIADLRQEKTTLMSQIKAHTKQDVEDEVRQKKDRLELVRTRRDIEKQLEAERTVTASLTANLSHMKVEMSKREEETAAVRIEVDEMREQLRDVMFALEARDKIQDAGGAAADAAGGSISLPPPPISSPASAGRRKKHR